MAESRKPIRVLQLVCSLNVGGLERVVVDLADGLKRHGIECRLGCLYEAGQWAGKVDANPWIGGPPRRGLAGRLLSLARHVRNEHIELIHSHNPRPHLYGVLASILSGVPLVHTKHGRNYPDNPRRVWLNRQYARFSRSIVAVSEDVRRVAIDIEKVPEHKVCLIPNGIDVEVYGAEVGGRKSEVGGRKSEDGKRIRERIGVPADAFVVGSVGRFAAEKNYPLLVRAFAGLAEGAAAGSGPFLLLVGDGPERPRIEREALERGVLERCRFPGMQEDVAPWLAAMDVFCLSSTTEGMSITLLEAGASGRPAVVTDVGGNREVVQHGHTGLVVPGHDAGQIAAAFMKLRGEPALCAGMGRAARERVESLYSRDAMAEAYAGLYRKALRRG